MLFISVLYRSISICAKNAFICATTYLRQYYFCTTYSEVPAQKLPEVNMIRKRKTLQWKNTKNYYEVKLAESSMFAFWVINTKSSAKLSPTSSGLRKANPKKWCSHLLMSVTFFLYSFARPRACIFLRFHHQCGLKFRPNLDEQIMDLKHSIPTITNNSTTHIQLRLCF
jgi:hypothetical protein